MAHKLVRGATHGVALMASLAVAGCAVTAGPYPHRAQSDASFTNPILPSGPDPWVTAHDGVYYYTHTLGRRIALWRTRDIADLANAEQKTIWTPPTTGRNAHSIWAPELHRLNGRWYIYYTATESGFRDDRHRGVFVLENASADPMQGEWVDRGRVNTARPGIDGTVFQDHGTIWFAYSPYLSTGSGIAISRLANPWTIAGEEVVIAEPDKVWEDRGGRRILEGPEFLKGPDGRIFMSYSAGACWSDDYALGLLELRKGANPLARANWTKHSDPVLKSANGVFATGHNGFFTSPDGREQWIIYHANSGAGMGCTQRRAPHISRIDWRDGVPVFAPPAGAGEALRKPGSRVP
ncbi:family 43 glycosylhydrolase [Sphingomonas turrisvirgatae]|nr:glycoside hydrolase family 43 protein [Sphingomonas turrisvirgatae]